MSSSNAVSVTYVDESTYGVSPDPSGAIAINQIRFTSESLSGTPVTVESANIRTDRMSSGQVITGLDVGGDISTELARDTFADKFFALGLMNTWTAATADVSGVSFTIDGSDPQRGDLAGTGVGTGISVGDILKVTSSGTDYVFQVITVTDADNLVVACAKDQADFTGATSRRPAFVDVGSVQNSVTLAKAYEDVLNGSDEYSQKYSGCVVSSFNVNAEYGAIVTASYTLLANGYEQESPSYQQQTISGGGSVTAAPSAQSLNASSDAPLLTLSTVATDFCTESFSLTLENGMTPQTCIGTVAPKRYELGTAGLDVNATVHLSASAYAALMPKKMTQESIPMTFVFMNADGGYAFSFAAIQLSFPDASASGANQMVMLEASGRGKIGESGENQMRIYQI
jgi:hypothetical protein